MRKNNKGELEPHNQMEFLSIVEKTLKECSSIISRKTQETELLENIEICLRGVELSRQAEIDTINGMLSGEIQIVPQDG